MPDSKPNPSQITWAVESGRIDAAKSDALSRPKANSMLAHFPARGTRALAASAASVMLRWPEAYNVAAVQTMMTKTMTMQLMLLNLTSPRACGYRRGPTRFSTKLAWR